MDQKNAENDNSIWNDLFLDIYLSSNLDNTAFSNTTQVEPDDLDDFFSQHFAPDTDHEHPSISDENNTSSSQSDSQVTLEGEQPIEADSSQQSPDVVIDAIPGQTNRKQDAIMYQIHPPLSDYFTGNMSVKQQPKANNRSRYQCDGSRFLPDSRYNPMSINLPDSQSLGLQSNQELGMVATIVTDTPDRTMVHANDMVCCMSGAIRIGHGSFYVPLDDNDKRDGEKTFPRVSIIYKKCDDYTFDLTPFHPLTMFGITEKYIGKNGKNTGNAAKGKEFKRDYNLLSYKIVFHMALKEDNVIYISHTSCETESIHEKKATTIPSKRSASFPTETLSEEDSTSQSVTSSPTKKFKRSPVVGLPVTRVSKTHNINNDVC